MTILKSLCDEVAEFGIVELDNNLSAYVLDLLVTTVMPAPLFSNRLKVMSDRSPCLFASLEPVALI